MSDHTDDEWREVDELMRKDEARKLEEAYTEWCREMAETPEAFEPAPSPGFVADIELAPSKWLRLGLEVLECQKGVGKIETFSRVEAG